MEGLSERAYAAHSGLSRGAVQKARKNGRSERVNNFETVAFGL
jgi:hypothetical protein